MDHSNSSNNFTFASLPTPTSLDYVEIGLLAFMIFLGVPFNLLCFFKLLREQCRRSSSPCFSILFKSQTLRRHHSRKATSRLRILRLHLLAANLLVLCVYGLGEVAWLSTYQFLGGDFLCRCMAYSYAFCFYATSNLVSAIALDRSYMAKRIEDPRPASSRRGYWSTCIRLSPALAWTIAAVGATPQLAFWRTFQPEAERYPQWRQCMTVWKVQKYTLDGSSPRFEQVVFYERLYEGFHLALVFGIPVVIIACSYALIVCRFQKSITRVTSSLSSSRRASSSTVVRSPKCVSSIVEESNRSQLDTTSLTSPSFSPPPLASTGHSQHKQQQVFTFHAKLASTTSSSSMAVATLTRAKKRTMKTSAWILLVYILCWSPYNMSSLYCFLYPDSDNKYLEFLANLIVLNAVVNPFIYRSG